MGFDCGFDIYPRLEATAENKDSYQRFLDEITRTYGDVYDKQARRADGKVLMMPTDPDHYDECYIYFMVGECPHMPSNPNRCDYFLRFSSKVTGRLTAPAEPCIRGVHRIARKHFGSRVRFWHEMNETDDERQWGWYGWQEVNAVNKQLKELETRQESSLANSVSGEQSQPKSISVDAAAAGPTHPTPANILQASGSVQDASSSQPALNQPSPLPLPLTNTEKGLYAIRPIPGKGRV